ncbi:MAG: prenyltransferase/squalene oxidase repeat-containing protein, partial [Planctomycetaceae bacterium]
MTQPFRVRFRSGYLSLSYALGLIAAVCSTAALADTARDESIRTAAARGIEYLRTRGQAEDGSFSRESGSAVTSLCVAAILKHRPEAKHDPAIQKALKFIESNIRGDGGVYAEGSKHKNYETCIATAALIAANENGKYDSVLARARTFIKDLQWDEGEGLAKSDPAYGGAGYGGHSRPDLSNTSFMIEALRNLGEEADDESIQKALMFVARSQNLAGHGNDTKHAAVVG